jgi:hypothetical protein
VDGHLGFEDRIEADWEQPWNRVGVSGAERRPRLTMALARIVQDAMEQSQLSAGLSAS